MGKIQPGWFEEQSKLLGEITSETIKRRLLHDLELSIGEEREAARVYQSRAQYARYFPEIANFYEHIAAEEDHHLQKFSVMAKRLEGKPITLNDLFGLYTKEELEGMARKAGINPSGRDKWWLLSTLVQKGIIKV